MESIKTLPISTFLEETEKELSNRKDRPRNPYKSLPQMNIMTWGIKPQELMVIGARTSMGKTAYCLQIMLDFIECGKSIFYMSFEMKPKKILERMFITKYKIDNISLLKGEFSQYWDKWEQFCIDVQKMKVVFGDGFGANWRELNGFLQNCSVKPDIVIVDYVQGIASTNRNSKEFLDEYIREFRQRLVENDIAGIIVSQLNRTNPDSKNKAPQLHQLKGTGCLEEHSDSVVLLDWLFKTVNNAAPEDYKFHVAKNRNGRTGYVEAKFTPNYYYFEEKSAVDLAREKEEKSKPKEAGWDE